MKKIFGTEIFETFKNQVKERFTVAETASKVALEQLKGHYQSTVWSEEELERICATLETEKLHIVEAILGERTLAYQLSTQAFNTANDAHDKADKDFQVAQQLSQTFDQLDSYQAQYQAEIKDKATEQVARQARLDQLKWAEGLTADFEALDKAKRDEGVALSKLKEVETSSAQQTKAKTDLLEQQVTLLAQKSHIEDLQTQLKVLPTQITLAKQAEAKQAEIKSEQAKLDRLKGQLEENKNRRQAFVNQLEDVEVQILDEEVLKSEQANLTEMSLFFETRLKIHHIAYGQAEKEAERIKENWDSLATRLPQCEADYAHAKEVVDAKQADRRQMMIAQLQADLVDGESCPVCGALEHPLIENHHVGSDDELIALINGVKSAQDKYDDCGRQLERLSTQITEAEAQYMHQTTLVQTSQRELTSLFKQFRSDFTGNFPEDFDLTVVQAEIKKLTQGFEVKKRVNQDLLKQGQQLTEQVKALDEAIKLGGKDIENLTASVEKTRAEVKNLAVEASSQELEELECLYQKEVAGYETKAKDLQDEMNRIDQLLSDYQGQLKTMQTNLTDIRNDIQTIQAKLARILEAETALTHDETQAREWSTARQEIVVLSSQMSQYQATKARLEQEIKQLEESLQTQLRPDLSILAEKRQVALEDLKLKSAEKTKAYEGQVQAEKEVKAIQSILLKQEKAQADYQAISQLYQAIFGKSNVDKLDLETYVVQNYLEKVLTYANAQFINHLSNNRYQFELSEEGRDRRSNHGLDINVYDNETGESRSTDTLSGGETFIAALSIALALSEVVQNSSKGVPIDALFIDEGFGSLDQETLQKAIQVLEKIGENRLVGVISHVEEMKSTIGQQLVIKKKGSGRSQVSTTIQ